jgi:hypothetical protein
MAPPMLKAPQNQTAEAMPPATSDRTLLQHLHQIIAQARFLSASLLVHVILIVLAGSAVIIQRQAPAPDFEVVDGPLVQSAVDAGPPEPSAPEPPKPAMPTPTAPSGGAIDALATVAANADFALNTTGIGGIALGNAIGAGATDALKGMADGLAQQGMGRAGGTSMVKFFGKMTEVQSVVFVVDISGSMISGAKSAKTYDELEDEVKRVIRSLDPRTKFGIVAFSGEAFLYEEKLVEATSGEKQRAINWLRKQSPVEGKRSRDEEDKNKHHGTRADRGLEAAFKLQASTIFFVSDGEPTGASAPEVLKLVTKWQADRAKPAAINSVAYLADNGQKFMADLAKQNSGSFREINPKDARRE